VYSTERLFDLFARRLPADGVIVRRAIWLGETDGVYDPDGQLIEQLDAATLATRGSGIAGARGTDVTGGMRHRVDTAMALAALGIPSLIANGTTPGLLERALRGKPVPGTHIDAIPPTSR
jgi:isopentenyl phosphate kinase